MSKHMQLTITIQPYYETDLEGAFPKLARHLSHLDSDLVRQNPSLYELVGQLDQLLYRFDGTPIREVLSRHRDTLRHGYKMIQENVANRNLGQADTFLYRIEDIFEEIESQLA